MKKHVKFISKLYVGYMKCVKATSAITVNTTQLPPNSMVGFWHGDSFAMQFLAEKMCQEGFILYGLVTLDARGDYIAEVLSKIGVHPYRIPKDYTLRAYLKELYAVCENPRYALAIALDGPLGPYQQPKKTAYKLAKKYDKPLVFVEVSYGKRMTLWRRWDKYKIPLPFSKLHFECTQDETKFIKDLDPNETKEKE